MGVTVPRGRRKPTLSTTGGYCAHYIRRTPEPFKLPAEVTFERSRRLRIARKRRALDQVFCIVHHETGCGIDVDYAPGPTMTFNSVRTATTSDWLSSSTKKIRLPILFSDVPMIRPRSRSAIQNRSWKSSASTMLMSRS